MPFLEMIYKPKNGKTFEVLFWKLSSILKRVRKVQSIDHVYLYLTFLSCLNQNNSTEKMDNT